MISAATFLVLVKLVIVVGSQNVSPCPETFSYETRENGTDRWYGVIKYSSAKNLTGVWIHIILDRPADLLGNWFGPVSTCDNTMFVIRKPELWLQVGQYFSLHFFVKFNRAKPMPSLKTIKFNGDIICDTRRKKSTQNSFSEIVEEVPVTKFSTISVDNARFDSQHSDISLDEACGVVASRPTPLILHGQDTAPGQWPWHAALYHHKFFQIIYACGATLITRQHVVTAAHCVTDIGTKTILEPNGISVSLGKYNLKTFEEDFQNFGVSNIFIYPKYNPSRSYNDIAVLKLSDSVEITKFVRPCCLWDENSDLAGIVGKEGIVVGWDLNNDKSHKLMQAKLPVVSTRDCISSKEEYREFLSENNYCAGYRNGTAVCRGDSGSGMVFPKTKSDGKIVWYIRGIVSLSLVPKILEMCEVSNYNIFTDVAKFKSWITEVVTN